MANNSFSYSDVQKDMIAAIFKAINERQNLLIDNIFGNDIDLKELDRLERQLKQYQRELEQAFNNMKDTMISREKYLTQLRKKEDFEKGDILSRIGDLIQILEVNASNSQLENFGIDIKDFFSTFFNSLDQNLYQNDQQISAISNFIFKYQGLKDKILDVQELLGDTTEKIRGDKMYYGILLERADSTLKGKDASKLLKLSREQFEEFERKNADLFEINISRRELKKQYKGDELANKEENKYWQGKEGHASRLSLRRGISSATIYERMQQTFGVDFDKNNDILDQVYAVNSRNEAVKTRDIYTILFDDKLAKTDAFKNISSGRKLEMLFDKDFRSSVINYIENNTTINGNFNKSNLILQLQNLDTSKYSKNTENIYGHATGDVNFDFGNKNEAIQLKFKNEYQPWNGIGIQGALDAMSIVRTLYKAMSDPSILQGANLQDVFLNNLGITSDFIMNDPRIKAATDEMIYQEAENIFSSEQSYNIVGFI